MMKSVVQFFQYQVVIHGQTRNKNNLDSSGRLCLIFLAFLRKLFRVISPSQGEHRDQTVLIH
jgi:hypothetical protein